MSRKKKTTRRQKALVPKLRFPEFQGKGEWEVTSLDRVADFENGKAHENNVVETGEYIIVNSKFISTEGVIRKYTNDCFCPTNSGDILMVMSDVPNGKTIAKCYLVESDNRYSVNQRICKLTPKITLSKMLFYTLNRNPFYLLFDDGVKQTNLRKDDVLDCPILLPSLPEQKKIADCLSSIDELITAQTQKFDLLKSHKKGLMQQLFPAEGETVPKLRFPEFQGKGEWKLKTLDEVAKYENGKAHEQNISSKGDFVVVNSKFISTEGRVKKFSNAAFCIAEKEDILMVLSDVPNGKAIAKCFYVNVNNKYTVNQRICKITPIKAVSIMLFYIINRNLYFLAFDDGVKQTNLKNDDVLKCPIHLPNDLKEQEKIANCLSSIDELINAQTKKLELLKAHKKGLMQQLFPSTDKVSK